MMLAASAPGVNRPCMLATAPQPAAGFRRTAKVAAAAAPHQRGDVVAGKRFEKAANQGWSPDLRRAGSTVRSSGATVFQFPRLRRLHKAPRLCRRISMLLPVLALAAVSAKAQSIQVVNSASYAPATSFAPGTIVSTLGANLSNTIQAASNPANPPTSLGGVSVMIGGMPAGLFFVAPSQINAHIDPGVPLGQATAFCEYQFWTGISRSAISRA